MINWLTPGRKYAIFFCILDFARRMAINLSGIARPGRVALVVAFEAIVAALAGLVANCGSETGL